MTRDLTRLAADANRRVGVETYGFRHGYLLREIYVRTRPTLKNQAAVAAATTEKANEISQPVHDHWMAKPSR